MRQGETPRGMECRLCGCRHNEVVEVKQYDVTYQGKSRTVIKRRRRCMHCKLPFTTIESYQNEDHPNLPEDILPYKPPTTPETGVSAVHTEYTSKSGVYYAGSDEQDSPPLAALVSPPKKNKRPRKG